MKEEVTYNIRGKKYTFFINRKGIYITTLGGILVFLNIAIGPSSYTQVITMACFLLGVIGFSIVNKSLAIIVTIALLSFYLLLLVLDKIS